MWWGASAPAPACWIHPLHKKGENLSSLSRASSAPGCSRSQLSSGGGKGRRPKSRGFATNTWDPPCPSWAPLREPRLRREQERKKALALERSRRTSLLFNGKCSAEEAYRWAVLTRRPASGGLSRPKEADDPRMLAMKSLMLPALHHRKGSDASNTSVSMLSSKPPHSSSRRTSFMADYGEGAPLNRPAKASPKDGKDAEKPEKVELPETPAGHKKSDKPEKQRRNSVPKLTRRRNSLCDRLLEAGLNKMEFEIRRTMLLEGGRRGSFLGPAGAPKNLKEITSLYAGADRVIPHWDPDRLDNAFRRTNVSGVVTVGANLAEGLYILGHPYPFYNIIDRIVAVQLQDRQSLDLEDFNVLITAYEAELEERLETAFEDAAGSSGDITLQQLPEVLKTMGVPTMTGLAEEFKEMTDELDQEVFESIYEEVIRRAGLTNDEHKRLRLLFEELEDLDNTITAQEMFGALSWHESLTDLAGGQQVIKALVEETLDLLEAGRLCLDPAAFKKVNAAASAPPTTPSKGIISIKESKVKIRSTAFLAAASVLHGRISDGLRASLKRRGHDEEQVPSSALLHIFEELGFAGAVAGDVDSFLLACGLHDKKDLTFTEFFTIIFRYCQADGVTEAESKDINAVFKRFDEDESGTLEAGEIGPVIRWLGYQPTQYRNWDFMEEIGLQFHSHIDVLEFRRLAAKYKSLRLKEVRKVFLHKDRANDGYRIHVQELEALLNMVGYEPTREEIHALVEQAGGRKKYIDFHEFKQLELLHRRWVQQTMVRNGGFTDGELEKIHRHFMTGDHNNTGHISGNAMREIFFTIFPDTSKDMHIHSFIVMVMREHGVDPNTFCDFDEFMDLMKRIQEEMDRDMLMQSLLLRQELGYTGAEVKQFRDLYLLSDEDHSGDLNFEELCGMFQNVTNLDMSTKREIMALVMELGNEDGCLDFWGFLQVMHKVQNRKWRSMS